jgi:ribosomal subunit interface protein
MEIRYFLGDLKLNEREKEYVEKKILKTKKLLKKYSDQELFSEVEVGKDKKGLWKVELMVKTPHELYRVEKKGSHDFMAAVDMAEEAMMKQIRRDREKVRDSFRTRDKKAISESEI